MKSSKDNIHLNQLVITPSYIPIDSSVTLINSKIIDRLDDIGVPTIVLTMSLEYSGFITTPQLLSIYQSDRKVYRIRTCEAGNRAVVAFRKVMRKIFPFIFHMPDKHFIWEMLAILKLLRIKKECKIDVIHSISSPLCSHIVGYFAKWILKKPWICHLDDFWVDQTIWAPKYFDEFRFINVWLERMCFNKADIILSSSREILELVGRRYDDHIKVKCCYIPPSYEQRHYPVTEFKKSNKYKFVYLGKFYPKKREPSTLFQALNILKKKYPHLYDKLQVDLIGINCCDYQKEADNSGVGDIIKCEVHVDYLEATRRMREATVLVHFGYISDSLEEDIFISGKLFEYLGAERLILGLSTKSGPVADFISGNNGVACDYNNPEEIAQKMVQIMTTYSVSDLYSWKNPPHVEKLYSSKSVAVAYKQLFQSLVSHA